MRARARSSERRDVHLGMCLAVLGRARDPSDHVDILRGVVEQEGVRLNRRHEASQDSRNLATPVRAHPKKRTKRSLYVGRVCACFRKHCCTKSCAVAE